ncbi:hypothetical protein [Bradyrhizobium sp. SZCCHNR3118]|uniref:hypothetical protein n=1 Tax=Bradyrhizobium sp. SZCCHNR3118 TaxID=3057468 RepID=UPI0029169900|nr:hypothetical protein [Bradyrhizobium sp. SZCCHNR3118]
MNFPEGFQPPSQATIDRVNNPDTFVVTWWNGIPADNSGKRFVIYLTDKFNPMGTANTWTSWRSEAKQYASEAEAEEARSAILIPHIRDAAKVYPNLEAHVRTGGIPGKELT